MKAATVMKSTTLAIIETALSSDDTVHPEQAASILKNLRAENSDRKPRPGTIKQAAAILEVHPVTVRRYAQTGLLTPIRITSRKVRYDLNQVEALALRGGLDI
jgi:hypothetical protein